MTPTEQTQAGAARDLLRAIERLEALTPGITYKLAATYAGTPPHRVDAGTCYVRVREDQEEFWTGTCLLEFVADPSAYVTSLGE